MFDEIFRMSDTTIDATKWLGIGSVTATIGSVVGFITPDAIIPAVTAGVAICTGVVWVLRAPKDAEHQRQLNLREKWNEQLEDMNEKYSLLYHTWKEAATFKGVYIDEERLLEDLKKRKEEVKAIKKEASDAVQ